MTIFLNRDTEVIGGSGGESVFRSVLAGLAE
jgi:hypothetical protein